MNLLKFGFRNISSSLTKSQKYPPGLWVIGTPLGNVQDLSIRGKNALEQADFILCEDPKRTSSLLAAIGLENCLKKLKKFDAHSTKSHTQGFLRDMKIFGNNLAIVTDAGTPGVSDPGALLVNEAVQAGIRVTPFPGPSAVISLISVSGFDKTSFTFRGFFPRKNSERREELITMSENPLVKVYIWFESPHRILETLKSIAILFPSVRMVIGRELTKVHEMIWHGQAKELQEKVQIEINKSGEIGEWSFALDFGDVEQQEIVSDEWKAALDCLFLAKVPIQEATKSITSIYGISESIVFDRFEMLHNRRIDHTFQKL